MGNWYFLRIMKTKSAKAKGRKLQKWVCEQIGKFLNLPWGYDDEHLIQPRLMGQGGVDIVLRGEASNYFPFSIECKNTERLNLYNSIDQAKRNCKRNTDWLLFHTKNHSAPIVILDAETFFRLIVPIETGANHET